VEGGITRRASCVAATKPGSVKVSCHITYGKQSSLEVTNWVLRLPWKVTLLTSYGRPLVRSVDMSSVQSMLKQKPMASAELARCSDVCHVCLAR
jgi:hypothetical protein